MTLSKQCKTTTESGFTLVELAIVLMIIGLLIGGILRGQELMNNARVTTTIQQSKAYDGATTSFRDAYSALPGDMVNPDTRLANCAALPCSKKGNGDNVLGVAATAAGVIVTKAGTVDNTAQSESANFWQHLAVARLISGVDTSAAGSIVPAWGSMFPAAKIAGGFQVGYANIPGVVGGAPAISGHYLILTNDPTTGVIANPAQGKNDITPLRAAQIDRKLDDGLPQSGDVIGTGFPAYCTGVNYIETSETNDCNLMIRVQN